MQGQPDRECDKPLGVIHAFAAEGGRLGAAAAEIVTRGHGLPHESQEKQQVRDTAVALSVEGPHHSGGDDTEEQCYHVEQEGDEEHREQLYACGLWGAPALGLQGS